jgi:hypothetical protein
MANWREEYFAALGVRDEYEQANASLYDACLYHLHACREGRSYELLYPSSEMLIGDNI